MNEAYTTESRAVFHCPVKSDPGAQLENNLKHR